jgi:ketosteroid isomerase-like protein
MSASPEQLAELMAVQQQTTDLYNAGEIDAYFEFMHEDVIYNLAGEPAPVIGKVAVRAWYDAFLAQFESAHWSSEPHPVIVGTTGILSGPFVFTLKSVGQVEVVLRGQHTVIFTHLNGRWVKVCEHASLAPTATS